MQDLLYVIFLVVATFLWGGLFYKKDYHPQPKKVIFLTFVVGLFAMVPLFAYKYIYQNFLPAMSEYEIFKPLFSSAVLSGLFFFVANLTLLAIILFVVSGVLSLTLVGFRHPVLQNIKKSLKEEPMGFVTISVIVGIVIYLESVFEKFFSVPIVHTILGTILFLTIIEEYIKHLIVRFVDDKKLKNIDDAITLSIVVGLAFAFLESIIYAVSAMDFSIVFYRVFISIPIHIVASGIFGYYYGLAHFSKPITKNTGGDRGTKWLHKILTLKKDVAYSEEKIVEGLFFATLFHAINNILLEINLAFITIPIIVFGLMTIFNLYQLGENEGWMLKYKHIKKPVQAISTKTQSDII